MLASTEPDQPMQLVSQDDGKGQKKLHGEPGLEPEDSRTQNTQEGPALLVPRTSGIWGFPSFRAKAWNVERAHLQSPPLFFESLTVALLGLTIKTRLTSNSQRPTCICLLSAGIKDKCHHTWLLWVFIYLAVWLVGFDLF